MNTQNTGARHIRWQVIIVASGVALLATLLIYVALTFTTSLVPARGGTYIEGMVGQPQALNPLLCPYNPIDRDLCSLIFNGMFYLDSTGLLRPDLAARLPEVSPDGLVYTVTLRSDVRWHDGQPFTADDVLFTISLINDPGFPGQPDLVELWQTVQISRVNTYNLSFTLREPFAPFPDYLTLGIAPAHILRSVPAADLASADFNLRPIGTGPFKVDEIAVAHGQVDHVTLSSSSSYFGSQAFLDRLVFKFFADDVAVFNAYRAGQIQGIARVSYSDLPRLRQFPGLQVFSAPLASCSMIFMNLSNPDVASLQDKQVRQALFLALDRSQIVERAQRGQGLVMPGPILPGTWAFDPTLPEVKPDPDKARALLDAAGWRVGGSGVTTPGIADPASLLPPGVRSKDGKALSLRLLTNTDPVHQDMARLVAEQWGAVGVTVTVNAVPRLVANYLTPRSYEAVLIDLSLAGDPDPYPFWHETQAAAGQNFSGYKDRDMSEILEQARRTNDRNLRAQFYQRFQKMFMDAMPAIPLSRPIFTFAVDERVREAQIGLLEYPSDRFRNVTDWYIVTRRVIVSNREP